jgi:hypothetical protein
MIGSLALTILIAISSLLSGIALGWYLRRANAWCPQCGGLLTCQACGSRPTWSTIRRNQRSPR